MSQNLNDPTNIIFQKEKEWRDLLLEQLEKTKTERSKAETYLSEFQEKFKQLEMDFKHNLNLLQERDDELNGLEKENEMLRESVYENEDRISNLSVEIDRLKVELKASEETKNDLREKLQQVMEKGFSDVQAVKIDKAKEIQRLKDEFGEKVKSLERKIIQMEAEAKDRQYSLLADVEETLRSREGELKRQTEQVHSEMLNYELKYRLASKELDLARASKAEIMRKLTEKEDNIRELEMRFGEMELASKSELSIEKMKRETEALHSKEKEINFLKEIERLARKLDERSDILKKKAEVAKRLEGEIRTVLNNGREKDEEKMKEKELLEREMEEILRKNRELLAALDDEKEAVSRKDSEIARMLSRMTDESAKKDGELRNIRLEMDSIVQQLRKKQEELLELRNELEYAIGKDLELSRRKEGEREDWESKIEKVRIEEMAKVEAMIKAITRSRDENLAEVKELRKQVEDRKQVKLCVNCSKESFKESVVHQKEEEKMIDELNKQNQQLRQVIAQMTEEATRQVNQQPTEIVSTNRHISSLAERNRQLQQEKIELLATSRKLQARLEATESDNNEMKRKVRERETEISQVKFELDSLQRHTGMDVRQMRRTLQELETELAVSRKEAEEYYKGNLELGRVVEDLQSELTYLKTEKFENFPTLNFGAQEMLIEQLKQEIGDLRAKLVYPVRITGGHDERSVNNDEKENGVLRKKLKIAANHIKSLASEKQVLIQISNRLRSELKLAGIKLPSGGNIGRHPNEYSAENEGNKDIKQTINDLENKLGKLEQLQKDLKTNCTDNRIGNAGPTINSQRDIVSSVGRESVDEVFKLLDDTDSLGQSSIIDTVRHIPKKSTDDIKFHNNMLWSKSVKLNSPKTRTKRNMVTNR